MNVVKLQQNSTLLGLGVFVTALGLLVAVAHAQLDGGIALTSAQCRLDRFDPNSTAGVAVMQVDECTTITVEIISWIEDLTTSIQTPGGQTIDPSTIDSFGGMYAAINDGEGTGIMIFPGTTPGWHYLYRFPHQGNGNYTISYSAAGVTQEEAVVVELQTDSPLGCALFSADRIITRIETTTLVAAVFEATANPPAVAEATVNLTLVSPEGTVFTGTMLDDGQGNDHTAGDGLYSYEFTPTEVGSYLAAIEVAGTNSHGTAFTRQAGIQVDVMELTATLTGALSDQGVDTNGNGLFEKVEVTAEANVSAEGDFVLHVSLRTAGDKVILGRGEATLGAGTQNIVADIPAENIRATNEDGPYTIDVVELSLMDPNGLRPMSALGEGTQLTQAYQLTEFERARIELTGVNSESTTDDEPDGDFDTLTVNIGVSVLDTAWYDCSAALVDSCDHEIELVSELQELSSGETPQAVVLEFDGSLIGANGIDGPYEVRNLALGGPDASLIVMTVTDTSSYAATSFDSYTPPIDCNDNLTPDSCDLIAGSSEDCNLNDVPDECEPQEDCNSNDVQDICDIANCDGAPWCSDCNDNGVPDGCETDCQPNGIPDECDIADGTSLDCNDNGVPDECEDDCNGNSTPDDCDIWAGTSDDCNGNDVPDECEIDANSPAPGGPFYCTENCDPDCNENGIPDECDLSGVCKAVAVDLCEEAEPICPRIAYIANVDGATDDGVSEGCYDYEGKPDVWFKYTPDSNGPIEIRLRQIDPNSYPTELFLHDGCPPNEYNILRCGGYDPDPLDPNGIDFMVTLDYDVIRETTYWIGMTETPSSGDHELRIIQGPDCFFTDLPNDCNDNGTPDDCDVSEGTSGDCNDNGVPDECEDECGDNRDLGCPRFDFDDDCDIDLLDFLAFQTCYTGPGGGPLDPGCECADSDDDEDVDLVDYLAFQTAFTGPGDGCGGGDGLGGGDPGEPELHAIAEWCNDVLPAPARDALHELMAFMGNTFADTPAGESFATLAKLLAEDDDAP